MTGRPPAVLAGPLSFRVAMTATTGALTVDGQGGTNTLTEPNATNAWVITANNAYRENEAGNPGYGETAAWFAKTTVNNNGTGYDAEFRISLALLGNPKPGDKICPITDTKANPKCTWIVGGKTYQFCCPPCIDEFVRLAKENPDKVKDPEEYVQQ